jgi:hypothetical protein
MPLNQDFKNDVLAFMSTHPMDTMLNIPAGEYYFNLVLAKRDPGLCLLELNGGDGKKGDDTNIHAWWLPYKGDGTTTIKLKSKGAGYFFTAGLGGCRVCITMDDETPKVAHIGGGWNGYNDLLESGDNPMKKQIEWRDAQMRKWAGEKQVTKGRVRTFSQTQHYGGGGQYSYSRTEWAWIRCRIPGEKNVEVRGASLGGRCGLGGCIGDREDSRE